MYDLFIIRNVKTSRTCQYTMQPQSPLLRGLRRLLLCHQGHITDHTITLSAPCTEGLDRRFRYTLGGKQLVAHTTWSSLNPQEGDYIRQTTRTAGGGHKNPPIKHKKQKLTATQGKGRADRISPPPPRQETFQSRTKAHVTSRQAQSAILDSMPQISHRGRTSDPQYKSPHRTWRRLTTEEVKHPTRPAGGGSSYDSTKYWRGTTEQFDPEQPFSGFSNPPPDTWRAMLAPNQLADYNITELLRLERLQAGTDTPFGKALATQLRKRGTEKVLRCTFVLPEWLKMAALDKDPAAAANVYITISRGVDLCEGAWPAASHTRNHSSCNEGSGPALVSKELKRLISLGYLVTWEEAQAAHPSLEQYSKPWCVHALGIVLRKGKCRVVVDCSLSTTPEGKPGPPGTSLNDMVDIEGRTKYTTIQRTMDAMEPRAYVWGSDFTDCFLQNRVAVSSLPVAGLMWQGVYYVYLSLWFGTRYAPCIIQLQGTMVVRHIYDKLNSAGLATGTPPEFASEPPTNRPLKHKKTPRMTNLGLILDDLCAVATGLRPAMFSFYMSIHVVASLGYIVAEAKTSPPTKRLLTLGAIVDCRQMTCTLPADKVNRIDEIITEHGKLKVLTRKQLQSAIGLFHWCAIAIQGPGRCALQAFNAELKGKHRTSIPITEGMRRAYIMWKAFISIANGRDVKCAIRYPLTPWCIYTDASHSGFSYVTTAGLFRIGSWPTTWSKYIGQHEQDDSIIIAELECLTIILALRELAPQLAGSICRIYSDNSTTIGAIKKMASKSSRLNILVQELVWRCIVYDVVLDVRFVHSACNSISDLGSRLGTPGYGREQLVVEQAKLLTLSRAFRYYPHVAHPPARQEFMDLLQFHTVDLSDTGIALPRQGAEDLKAFMAKRAPHPSHIAQPIRMPKPVTSHFLTPPGPPPVHITRYTMGHATEKNHE